MCIHTHLFECIQTKKCRNNLRVCFTSQFVSQLFEHLACMCEFASCEFVGVCVCACVCGAATHSMLGRETMLGCGYPNSTVTRTITHTRSCAIEISYLSALHCSYAYLFAPIVFVSLTPIVVFIAFRTVIDEH